MILWTKNADGTLNFWMCEAVGSTVVTRWGRDGGATQTSEFECKPKNVGRSNATTAEQQAVLEAEALRKKQQKKKGYFPTKEEALRGGAEPGQRIDPMLAQTFDPKKVQWPLLAQAKLDGLRCLAYLRDGQVVLQSRGNDRYEVPHVAQELTAVFAASAKWVRTDRVVLDGELYAHGLSLQTITSLVRGKKDTREIGFWCYDCYDPDLPQLPYWSAQGSSRAFLRLQLLDAVRASHVVRLVTDQWVTSYEEAKAFHDDLVQEGYEGAILRAPQGVYRMGARSKDLLKLKEFQDAEFEIVGHTTGKGKFENAPVFICKMPDSQETFEVTPKGSMRDRAEMLAHAHKHVGSKITVRFFGYTDAGLPRIPVGHAIRYPNT